MKYPELQALLKNTFGHLTDASVMALTIYGEARGEQMDGRIAVGSVILERDKRGGWYGKSIKDVCLKPWQFSCFLPADPNFESLKAKAENWEKALQDNTALRECLEIAAGLLGGIILPNVIATHYETLETHADWEASLKPVRVIGRHKFFV